MITVFVFTFIFPVESVSPDIDSPNPYDARHSDLFSGGMSGLNDQLHDSSDLDLNKILDLVRTNKSFRIKAGCQLGGC